MINQDELIPCMVIYRTVGGLKYTIRTMALSPTLKTAVVRKVKRPIFIVEYGKLVESFIRNNRSVIDISPEDDILVCSRCSPISNAIDEVLFEFKMKDYLNEVGNVVHRVDYDPA